MARTHIQIFSATVGMFFIMFLSITGQTQWQSGTLPVREDVS